MSTFADTVQEQYQQAKRAKEQAEREKEQAMELAKIEFLKQAVCEFEQLIVNNLPSREQLLKDIAENPDQQCWLVYQCDANGCNGQDLSKAVSNLQTQILVDYEQVFVLAVKTETNHVRKGLRSSIDAKYQVYLVYALI